MTVTIKNVAKLAGVSIATVSRVQNGVGQVSPETKAKVLAAIRQLNYVPNRIGQALQKQRHGALGIVFPDFSGPYYGGVLLGLENQAVTAGYSVLVLATHRRQESARLITELSSRVDGMVIMDRTVSDSTISAIADSGIPIVLLARSAIGDLPSVRSENQIPAIELMTHLTKDHGYRSFAFLGDPQIAYDVTERWRAVNKVAHEQNLARPKLIRCGYRQQDGYQAAQKLLTQGTLPQCLLCANDEVAFGVYQALRENNIRIPDEIAVTGWDDIPTSELISPPLTSVQQPTQQLGDLAAQKLIQIIETENTRLENDVLSSRLVLRNSCGCNH
ncbi:LacI family DNA-binding transcriptional regulator [Sulfoacidibacillus thermotolerans]|uniref:LacI family DNA-binding transcriptional regulator n=1 Tax=Sulfoacidibacillus thermotolerans TaxID=1765684 RepID=UPI000D697119|nr:LacI family DNA-binding transcriptional regulator [Sulfoacidibacillus thermotolerans]